MFWKRKHQLTHLPSGPIMTYRKRTKKQSWMWSLLCRQKGVKERNPSGPRVKLSDPEAQCRMDAHCLIMTTFTCSKSPCPTQKTEIQAGSERRTWPTTGLSATGKPLLTDAYHIISPASQLSHTCSMRAHLFCTKILQEQDAEH